MWHVLFHIAKLFVNKIAKKTPEENQKVWKNQSDPFSIGNDGLTDIERALGNLDSRPNIQIPSYERYQQKEHPFILIVHILLVTTIVVFLLWVTITNRDGQGMTALIALVILLVYMGYLMKKNRTTDPASSGIIASLEVLSKPHKQYQQNDNPPPQEKKNIVNASQQKYPQRDSPIIEQNPR